MALIYADLILLIVLFQIIILPLYWGIYIGIKTERQRKEDLFYRSINVIRRQRRPYA